jgi:hypothetical protein
MYFEIVGPITNIERIAVGTSIRLLSRLRRRYGRGRWRKLKGMAMSAWQTVSCAAPRSTGTRRMGSDASATRSSGL